MKTHSLKYRSMLQQRGGILLEAMVSVAIFAIAIVGLLGSMAASVNLSGGSRYRTEAAMITDELLGQMAGLPAQTLADVYAQDSSAFTDWATKRVSWLPNGQATIAFASSRLMDQNGIKPQGTFVTLVLTWQASHASSADQYQVTTYFYRQ